MLKKIDILIVILVENIVEEEEDFKVDKWYNWRFWKNVEKIIYVSNDGYYKICYSL